MTVIFNQTDAELVIVYENPAYHICVLHGYPTGDTNQQFWNWINVTDQFQLSLSRSRSASRLAKGCTGYYYPYEGNSLYCFIGSDDDTGNFVIGGPILFNYTNPSPGALLVADSPVFLNSKFRLYIQSSYSY